MKLTDMSSDQSTHSHAEQAAHWWVVLNDDDCTAEDRKAFVHWVKRSPQHIEAFLQMSRLGTALSSSAVRWPDTPTEILIETARASISNVVALEDYSLMTKQAMTGTHRPVSKRGIGMLLYGSLAALMMIGIAVWLMGQPVRYRTAIGEQRSVVLEDGSLVTLNTASSIEVSYGRNHRLVRLTGGEALFQVAHDTSRPFDVTTENVTIRAVGTQFNVDRRADHTTVTVVEGTVRVSTDDAINSHAATTQVGGRGAAMEMVTAAQRVVATGLGLSAPEPVVNVAPVMAWTQRQLVFDKQPLYQVAEEFNRYNRHRIVIESEPLRLREVTGVFQANDAESFLVFVSRIPGVHIQTNRDGHRIVTFEPTEK